MVTSDSLRKLSFICLPSSSSARDGNLLSIGVGCRQTGGMLGSVFEPLAFFKVFFFFLLPQPFTVVLGAFSDEGVFWYNSL